MVGSHKVTRILCGYSAVKMRDDLVKNGFVFESQRELKVPRFIGKDLRF
jgi:hypothetical protein